MSTVKSVLGSALNTLNTRVGKRVSGIQKQIPALQWPGREPENPKSPQLRYRNESTKKLFPFGDGRCIQEFTQKEEQEKEKTESSEEKVDRGTYILLEYDTIDRKEPKPEVTKTETEMVKVEASETLPPKPSDSYFEVYRNTYIEPVIRTVGRVRDILPFTYNSVEKSDTVAKAQPKAKVKVKVERKIPLAKDFLYEKTYGLLVDIRRAESNSSLLTKLQELSRHLTKYPESTGIAVKHGMVRHVKFLLSSAQSTRSTQLVQQCHQLLSLLGQPPPTRRRGVRILAIDGGGTRGLITLEVLGEIERRCGRPIYKLFDYICGVSTGALIAAMVGIFRVSPAQAEAIYRQFSREMFERNSLMGTGQLVLSHAYYDADIWERILRNHIGEKLMVDTAKNPGSPKVGVVSCLMNGPVLKTFVFRSYNLPPESRVMHMGSSHYKIWEAIRASSAAPGYFPEFKLDGNIHLDGGLHTNNPAAVAIHETRCLWPHSQVQCLVSIGNGRYEPVEEEIVSEASLKAKLTRVVQSATDTEATHHCLQDLLPTGSYFRLNPYMCRDFPLDEIRPSQLDQIQRDTRQYLDRNHWKLDACTRQLLGGKVDVPLMSTYRVRRLFSRASRTGPQKQLVM